MGFINYSKSDLNDDLYELPARIDHIAQVDPLNEQFA